MTETLNGKQVLALLAQDEPPEIEYLNHSGSDWFDFRTQHWDVQFLRLSTIQFRIKPTPARRLSVTLANGEVVSWPEPVREKLKGVSDYWVIHYPGDLGNVGWSDDEVARMTLAFGNVHLTREAAQEHADALRKINTQGVV